MSLSSNKHTQPAKETTNIVDNMQALIGQALGQYTIIEQIGQGGMATVFKAYQPSLERDVALKVLPPSFAKTGDFSERFSREARAIANLHHPNILPVYDSGQDRGYSYIAMRYIKDASTLADRMKESLSPDRIVDLITQISAALDHAHQSGIIHRDIKPSNVLMDGDWPLLSDFGLAKMVEDAVDLTGTGVGMGTPSYMSPEQGMGKKVDHRTDIYALGIILFEMLTGIVPHRAETPIATVMKRINEPLPMPRTLNPDLPEAVERVLLKALAPTPDLRFDSAGKMATALKEAFEDNPATLLSEVTAAYNDPKTTLSATPSGTVIEPPITAGGGAKARKFPFSVLGLALVGGLLVLMLCGLGAFIYFQMPPERSPITWQYLLDVSQEMEQPFPGEEESKWAAAQETLAANLTNVPDQINVGLRVFGQSDSCTESELLIEPAPAQADLIRDEIEALAPSGSQSPLSEALVNAFNDLNLGPDERNALIVLTDGADSCDPAGAEEVAQFMERLNLRIDTYIVGLNITEPAAEESLRTLADAGDGVFLTANSSDELHDVLEQIQDNLQAERPPRTIAQAPPPTPTPPPTETPAPLPTEVPTSEPPPAPPTEEAAGVATTAQEAYELVLAEMPPDQAVDAAIIEMQTSSLGFLQPNGTSTSWNVKLYSPATEKMTTAFFIDGKMEQFQTVNVSRQTNPVYFDDTVILDTQRIYDIAAEATDNEIIAAGFVPSVALIKYPLDETLPTWYVNYSNPGTYQVAFTVIIDARSGEVIQAIDVR